MATLKDLLSPRRRAGGNLYALILPPKEDGGSATYYRIFEPIFESNNVWYGLDVDKNFVAYPDDYHTKWEYIKPKPERSFEDIIGGLYLISESVTNPNDEEVQG